MSEQLSRTHTPDTRGPETCLLFGCGISGLSGAAFPRLTTTPARILCAVIALVGFAIAFISWARLLYACQDSEAGRKRIGIIYASGIAIFGLLVVSLAGMALRCFL